MFFKYNKSNVIYYLHTKKLKRLSSSLNSQNSNNLNAVNSFVEFPSKHLYTRTLKTFELRKANLDSYMKVCENLYLIFTRWIKTQILNYYFKKLFIFYENNLPNELVQFLELEKEFKRNEIGIDDIVLKFVKIFWFLITKFDHSLILK